MQNSEKEFQQQLSTAQTRLNELQQQQSRNLQELQALREEGKHVSNGRSQALDDAEERVRALEGLNKEGANREKQLQDDVNKLLGQLRELRTKLQDEQTNAKTLQATGNSLRHQVTELEQTLDSQDNISEVKAQLEDEIVKLRATIASLTTECDDAEVSHDRDRKHWAAQREILEAQRRKACLLYTSPSPRDGLLSRMPSSA